MKTIHLELAVGVLCFLSGSSMSAKVIVLPLNINSHIMYHARIARLLADEGHVVDIVLASPAKVPDVIKESDVQILKFFSSPAPEECNCLLNDNNIRKNLNDGKYDVAILDLLGLKCRISLLRDINIHKIIFGLLDFDPLFRIPILPSFVPSKFSTLDDGMSFLERLRNTAEFITSTGLFPVADFLMAQDRSPAVYIGDAMQQSALYFVLDDISIAYPKPSMPNIIYIGDAIPTSGKPLPTDIDEFVDRAEAGVIIVSFGSFFDLLPQEIIEKFCLAFKTVPQNVIWKLKNRTLCDADPGKVLLLDWLPQNDLLSHGNVKLFISHCGINSILEAVYHSTPIIGFPIAIDQPYNAARLENRGLGYRMNLYRFSVEELVGKIAAILSDHAISTNIDRASSLLRNKPDTPAKRISYWVEHIAIYGDKHLKGRAYELSIFQFYCLDVLLVILFIVIAMSALSFYCTRSTLGYLASRCRPKKAKVD
ncbi:hypothetical protein LSH36_296g04055 [Paralvinella palmiformis]|uniref:UDP-glucuronosyltransferase n=1 Tax=Paralvinella palmiformis TaxID=53620 RepID=A0AAD9N1A2_9ANNE|nr:hypothetical protein LSH36_296g04055 [Paralvinella palmiformis]